MFLRQSAVVRGAALRGLEGIAPRIKRARRHYGYSISMPFREGTDPEELGWISDFNDVKYCRGRVKWLIAKASNNERAPIPSLLIYGFRARRSITTLSERLLLKLSIHPARLSSWRPCCIPVRSTTPRNMFLIPVRHISTLKVMKARTNSHRCRTSRRDQI